MLRRLRQLLFALTFAVLGAVAGRLAAECRRAQERGEPACLRFNARRLGPRDVVPGVVAAMRANSLPWSILHVPPWLAAFTVNFALAAFAREIASFAGARGGEGDRDGVAEPAPGPVEGFRSWEPEPGGRGAAPPVDGEPGHTSAFHPFAG